MATHGSVGVDACAQIVTAATHTCPAVAPVAEPQHFDALAATFGALANALTLGAIIIAVLIALVGFAWGRFIASEATDEAVKAVREEVERVAEGIMNEWLSTDGLALLPGTPIDRSPHTTGERSRRSGFNRQECGRD